MDYVVKLWSICFFVSVSMVKIMKDYQIINRSVNLLFIN